MPRKPYKLDPTRKRVVAPAGAKPTRVGPTQTGGSTGVYAWGGHLIQTEKKENLRGRLLYSTFENLILNTAIVGASVRYFQSLIGGTSWTVTAREDAGADGERAVQIVNEGLLEANMAEPWSIIIKKAALYRYYGFSIHEWAIRRRPKDGMIVYKTIEHRPQYTVDMWQIDEDGGPFQGMWQRVPGRPELFYVPRDRMYYCVDSTLTDSPDGLGLLRHCAEPGRRLERLQQLEGFGYEGDMRGMPVARVPGAELMKQAEVGKKPAGWIEDQTRAMHNLVANHVKSPFMGIVLDSATYSTDTKGAQNPTISAIPKWAIEIIKGTPAGLAEINVTIERLNREIARVLGMEHLLLGGDGKGSLALSQDKTSMFASVLEATLDEMAWFTVHDLVYPLLEMNGLDPETCCPQVMPDPIATERIEATVDALLKLSQAGAILMPDDPAINQIRGRLHLADQPEITPELIGTMARANAGDPLEEPMSDTDTREADREDSERNRELDREDSETAAEREDERLKLEIAEARRNKPAGKPAKKTTFRHRED